MTSITINLNDFIKVKLTDLGKEIFFHRADSLNQYYGREVIKPTYPQIDEKGFTTFQLWEFMSLYGEHIGMAKPNIIEPLEIVCEVEGGNENEK